MPGVGHDQQRLGLRGTGVGVLAEFTGVGIGAGNQQQRAWGDRLDVVERVEVHELHVAGQRWPGGGPCRGSGRGELPTWCAVEIVELIPHGIAGQHMRRTTGVEGFATLELNIALVGGLEQHLPALFQGHAVLEPVTVGRAHVVHADRGDGLEAWVDFRRADGEAATATHADDANAFTVDHRAAAEEIHGGTEIFAIEVGQHRIARLACAFTPERQVQGQGDKALFGHLGGVQVGALFFDGSHRVAHDDCGILCGGCEVFGHEQIARHPHAVLVVEGDLFHAHLVAGVEVTCTVGHVGSQ